MICGSGCWLAFVLCSLFPLLFNVFCCGCWLVRSFIGCCCCCCCSCYCSWCCSTRLVLLWERLLLAGIHVWFHGEKFNRRTCEVLHQWVYVCVCVWTWWASATMSSSPAPIISSSLNEALTARGIDTSEFLLRISTCPQSYLLQLDVTPFNAQGKMVQTRSRQWGVVAHSSVLLVWPQTSKIL